MNAEPIRKTGAQILAAYSAREIRVRPEEEAALRAFLRSCLNAEIHEVHLVRTYPETSARRALYAAETDWEIVGIVQNRDGSLDLVPPSSCRPET